MLTLADDSFFYLNHKILTELVTSPPILLVIQNHVNNAYQAYEAMDNFCKRVELGQIGSKDTYKQFMDILEKVGYRNLEITG